MNLTLTNNFYTWMRSVLLQTNTSIGTTTTGVSGHGSGNEKPVGVIKNTDGVEQTGISIGNNAGRTTSLNSWSSGSTTTEGNTYFEIGSNNVEPTADDYCLSSYTLGTDYSATWRAIGNATMVNDKAQLAFSISVTAINDIAVGEVGMFKYIRGTGNVPAYFLLGRATFDEPISLASGESVTFQVTIEI